MILSKTNIDAVDLDEMLDDYVRHGNFSKLLIVVPTNRKLRSLKKELIEKAPHNVASEINIETIGTLAQKIAIQSEPFSELSEAASSVFIKQSTEKVSLNYFTNYKDKIPYGTLERIRNVISKYKESGISPERILSEAENLERKEKLKAKDISVIYTEYNRILEEKSLCEIGDIYKIVDQLSHEQFEKNLRSLFPEVDLIIVNGFDELTVLEVGLLDKCTNIEGGDLYLDFDYFSYNPMLFTHLDKCYTKLIEAGFEQVLDKSPGMFSPFRKEIRENLFKKKSVRRTDKYSQTITCISSFNRITEVQNIAKEIKDLIEKRSVKPSEICVAFNLIENYSPIVRDVFTAYGIPLNLTDRIHLKQSTPVITIIHFLEIIENNFHIKNIARAFNSPLVPGDMIDVNNLYEVAKELKITMGLSRWQESIEYAKENIDKDELETYEIDRLMWRYDRALEDIKFVESLVKPFMSETTVDEFLDNIDKFINQMKLPVNVLGLDENYAEQNVKGLTVFLETIEEIFTLLSNAEGEKTKHRFSFYLTNIRTAANWARFNIKEKSDYGVLVTNLSEIRGLEFEYLFLGGMVDGDFPTKYSPEIFLSGSFVKQENIHQCEERYRFYQALCTWTKGLFLTHPKQNLNDELVRSVFLNEFLNLFEVTYKDDADYKDNLYSLDELLSQGDLVELIEGSGNEGVKNEINLDEIKHKKEIDRTRIENPYDQNSYNGFLLNENELSESEIIVKFLQEYSEKEFSVTELETYAKCPFKFFIERVLKISVIEEPTEEMEAIELGSLLHSILFEFYSNIRSEGITLQGCDASNFRKSEKILLDIANEKIGDLKTRLPLAHFDIEKILGIDENWKQSILYQFLKYERENVDGYLPSFFEVKFGSISKGDSDSKLSNEQSLSIDNIKLRGKIDRIEINESENSFSITDYKLSGKKPSSNDLWRGISLQLPVYFLAAKSLLKYKTGNEINPGDMFIFSLKFNESDFGKNRISLTRKKNDREALNNRLIDESINNIKQLVQNISEGKFNLTELEDREEKVCKFCELSSVCRIEELT